MLEGEVEHETVSRKILSSTCRLGDGQEETRTVYCRAFAQQALREQTQAELKAVASRARSHHRFPMSEIAA